MPNLKKTTTVLLVTFGLGTALFAFGPGGHRGGPFAGKQNMEIFKLVKKLDLSSEQEAALKTVKESQRAQMREKMESFKKDRESMMKQMKPDMSLFMSADSFDKEAFKSEMKKKFEARRKVMETKGAEMLENRASGIEKVFNILTPEQRIKWIELSKEV